MIADRLTTGEILCEGCYVSATTAADGCILCSSCNQPLDETRVDGSRCQRCGHEFGDDEVEDILCDPCCAADPVVDGRCDPCRAMGALPFHPEFEGMVQVPEEEMPVRCSYCRRRVWAFAQLQSPRIRRLYEREWQPVRRAR